MGHIFILLAATLGHFPPPAWSAWDFTNPLVDIEYMAILIIRIFILISLSSEVRNFSTISTMGKVVEVFCYF